MRCTGCDNIIPDSAKFCPICGARQPLADVVPPRIPSGQQQQIPPPPQYRQYGNAEPAKKLTSPCHAGFGEAIALYFKNYVNFKGRSTRSEYWFAYLFTWLVTIACYAVSFVIPGVSYIASLAFFIPSMAIQCRRFHDTGRKGIMTIISNIMSVFWSTAVAILIFVIILDMIAYDASIDLGDPIIFAFMAGLVIFSVVPFGMWIYCTVICCLPSKQETNKYGSPAK